MAPPKRRERECVICKAAFIGILHSKYCGRLCKQKADHDTRKRKYAEDPEFRAKCNADVTRWRKRNPEKHLAIRRRAWGVLNPTGERRVGPCEICGDVADPLNLDHDHVTGRVRGWLCAQCNQGIGKFRDDTARLRAAIEYLDSRRKVN